jgi:catechol 2,3-dioxygenase-like lactoylglutathione lyase family enzyme
MVKCVGLGHLHLKVADVERSARFYEQGLGMMRLAVKHEGKAIVLFIPGRLDVLTLSEGAIGAEVDHTSARVGDHGGFDHFGFVLSGDSDLDEAVEQLTLKGAAYLRHFEIAPGVPSVFVRDPDGYVFQLWKLPPGAAERAAAAAESLGS